MFDRQVVNYLKQQKFVKIRVASEIVENCRRFDILESISTTTTIRHLYGQDKCSMVMAKGQPMLTLNEWFHHYFRSMRETVKHLSIISLFDRQKLAS